MNAGSGRLTPYMAVRVGDERIRLDDDKVTVNRLRKKTLHPRYTPFINGGIIICLPIFIKTILVSMYC